MARSKSVRQQIIDKLYEKLEAMRDIDTGDIIWNKVIHDNLDELEAEELPAIAIEEGDERTIDNMQQILRKELTVFIEFRFDRKDGVDVYDDYKYYLAQVQKAVLPDHHLDNLASDVQEDSNSPRIADRNDPMPGGVLILTVRYRHRNDDPYKQLNE